MRYPRRHTATALLAGALLLAACGNGDNGTEGQPTDGTTPPAATSPAPPGTETGDPTAGEPTGGGELPGEPVEIFPYEGAELGVVGVAADDVLHVRLGPGVEFESIAQFEPLAAGIVATGHNRQLVDGSFWSEVTLDDGAGWANTSFLTHPGQVTDITSELDELPQAATMPEVGELVAQQRASEQPPSTVTVVDGPRDGDLSEIVVDVVGLGDDALGGERLHIFAVQEADGYTTRTVEATLLCTRGVTEDGLCV